MTSPSAFGKTALIQLAERTEYETWLLEDVYRLVEQELFPTWPDAVVYPLDNSKAYFFVHGCAKIAIGDWRPGFLNAGTPLIFVSTFKLLDMLFEWVLEENGVSSTYRFQQKLNHLKASLALPPLLESRLWLKERLIGLYRTLEPLRGTIIHDKHFTVTDGAIRVSSSKKGIIGAEIEISATNLRKLAVSIVSVLKYLVEDWPLDEFREKVLRHDLDELVMFHHLPLLGQKAPFHTCVRVYSTASDPFQVDLETIQRDLAVKYADQDYSFDLRILLVKNNAVVDAYLFPSALFASTGSDWSNSIDAHQYRTPIPGDINPQHLQNNSG